MDYLGGVDSVVDTVDIAHGLIIRDVDGDVLSMVVGSQECRHGHSINLNDRAFKSTGLNLRRAVTQREPSRKTPNVDITMRSCR